MKARISEPINLSSLTSKETLITCGKISEDIGKLTETLLTIAFFSHITSRENGTRFENKAFQLYYAWIYSISPPLSAVSYQEYGFLLWTFNQTQFVNSLVKILRVILFQDAKILSFFACDFFLNCSVLTPKSFLSGVYLPTSFLSGVCFLRLHGEKATTGFNQWSACLIPIRIQQEFRCMFPGEVYPTTLLIFFLWSARLSIMSECAV